MQCKDCKHWNDKDNDYGLGVGVCQRAKMFWDSTYWKELEDDDCARAFTKESEGELAFVQDGSDYKAELITRPEFGCVQFEEKA